MKIKKMYLMITLILFFALSINVFADCGNCEKVKSPCCDKSKIKKIEKENKRN